VAEFGRNRGGALFLQTRNDRARNLAEAHSNLNRTKGQPQGPQLHPTR
jgi:hypothetical protein